MDGTGKATPIAQPTRSDTAEANDQSGRTGSRGRGTGIDRRRRSEPRRRAPRGPPRASHACARSPSRPAGESQRRHRRRAGNDASHRCPAHGEPHTRPASRPERSIHLIRQPAQRPVGQSFDPARLLLRQVGEQVHQRVGHRYPRSGRQPRLAIDESRQDATRPEVKEREGRHSYPRDQCLRCPR